MRQKWIESEIIGNKQEAIEQAIESLKQAYSDTNGFGYVADAIECALNRLGVRKPENKEEERYAYT